MTFGVTNYPAALDDNNSLGGPVNNCSSTLASGAASGATTITLTDASLFPSTANPVYIGGEAAIYTSKSGNVLTLAAGLANTHAVGEAVTIEVDARYFTVLRDAIKAVEGTLGTSGAFNFSSSTLPSGKINVGNPSNIATPTTVSGDATLSNAGALAVTSLRSGVVTVPAAGTLALITDVQGRYVTLGGSANAYTATLSGVTALTAGLVITALVNAANTGASTFNLNSLGAVAVTKSGSTALASGDLPSGATVTLVYDGTRWQLASGAGSSSSGGATWAVARKSAAYTVVSADKQTFFLCSGTWTLALTAAATLGAGFVFAAKNNGTGAITIDPNGSETVQGAATLVLGAGDTVMLICDGSAWHLLDSYLTGTSPVFSNITTFTSGGTFTVPAGVYRIRVRCWGGGGPGGAQSSSGGTSGGTSSFGSLVSATGGNPGQSGAVGTTPAGGSGGNGSGGTVKPGATGGNGYSDGTSIGAGGGGASAGGISGNAVAGAPATNSISGAGASGSGGVSGGAANTSTSGNGNPGTAGGAGNSGGGGSGARSTGGGTIYSGGNGATPGAGGGGGAYAGRGGGGGGSGGVVEAVLAVTPGSSYSITVGAGGVPVDSSGGNGGGGLVTVEY